MLLAIDTSTQWIGIALYDGTQVLGELTWQTKQHHTVELSLAIEDLLKRCNIKVTALKTLAVARGPGAFTGLRIGMAVVKGMALALHLPVISIPTFDILAYAQPVQDLPLGTILQAGRKRLAVGWYAMQQKSSQTRGNWIHEGENQLTTAEDLANQLTSPTLLCGEMNSSDRKTLKRNSKFALMASPAQSARHPSNLAELAWKRWKKDDCDDVVTLAPIYLKTTKNPGESV